jgi:uncharacterized membrane protein YccC
MPVLVIYAIYGLCALGCATMIAANLSVGNYKWVAYFFVIAVFMTKDWIKLHRKIKEALKQ